MKKIIAYQPNNRVVLFKTDTMTEHGLAGDQVTFWQMDWLTGRQEHYKVKDIVAKWTIKIKKP